MVDRAPPVGVRGLRIGHAETPDGGSGVSVLLFEPPALTVVDLRGGASATYDLGSLSLDATFGRRWAIFLAGGSLFGLDAAAGVRDWILEHGGGSSPFGNPNRVAPVSGAALFDLPRREERMPDYRELGRQAAAAASDRRTRVGSVGAGAGATVGKYRGRQAAMAGGIGWTTRTVLGAGRVGALVAVNAAGAVRHSDTGRWIAGSRGRGGRIVPPPGAHPTGSAGTTLAVVVTDLALDRPQLQRVSAIVHAGLGGTIVPFHTATDGDVLFAASTGRAGAPPPEDWPGRTADRVGSLAARCATEAVRIAVRRAA